MGAAAWGWPDRWTQYLAEGVASEQGPHVQVITGEQQQLGNGAGLGLLSCQGLPLNTGHNNAWQPQEHLDSSTGHQQRVVNLGCRAGTIKI